MNPLEYLEASCPYCGELIELSVDASAGNQTYVEDCSVCCRPMIVTAAVEGDAILVSLNREND